VVSNSVMTAKLRWAIRASITAAIFAVPYMYWLSTPVLQYVSIGRWPLFAIVVAAAFGGELSLLRVSTSALSCGAMTGLPIGETLAASKTPNDVAISGYGALASHLESFWRQALIRTFAATFAAPCCVYLRKRRVNAR
jgi:hypothetical protein